MRENKIQLENSIVTISFESLDNTYQNAWLFFLHMRRCLILTLKSRRRRSVQNDNNNNQYWTKTRTDKPARYMSSNQGKKSHYSSYHLLYSYHCYFDYTSIYVCGVHTLLWSEIPLDEIQKNQLTYWSCWSGHLTSIRYMFVLCISFNSIVW